MDTTLDLSRWRAIPRGIGYRRGVMVRTGIELLLRTRFFKLLVAVSWSCGLGIAAAGFVFSQAMATGGWLERLAAHLGPRAEALVAMLAGFVALYPDICIGGFFTLVFWVHAWIALLLALLALTAMVPRLITRDRASNALTIYLSRPLTAADYLTGKLGTIAGVIVLVWTGPLLFGWLLSMLFATNRDFVVYSVAPLGRALAYNAIALIALAAIALGVSALARTARITVGVWIGLWVLCGSFASPPHSPTWLRRASFSHDLTEVRQQILRPDIALLDAGTKLPLLDRRLADNLTRAGERAQASDFGGSLAGLGTLVVLSCLVFARKLRPE